MGLQQSYTLSEIEAESGFDKRTISYYISQGLLPKVGRRGPKTRYPQDFLERLMFIRRVRDLQDDGKLRAVTLTEICAVMNQLTAEEIRGGARRGGSIEWIRDRFEDSDWDTSELAVSAEEVAASMEVEEDAMVLESEPDYDIDDSSLLAPASKRRETLNLQLELQQVQMEKSRANCEQASDELKEMIYQFERRMDQMHHAMRDEVQHEMREIKDLVLQMHERLRDVENHIKRDSKTGEDDKE